MPPGPAPHFVFVYGTLKRGGVNHARLAGQTLVGPARLAAGHVLYSLGEYPGLVADPASPDRVSGEVWAVDAAALARLDVFEGVDTGLYARVPAPLAEIPPGLAPADAARVQMYLYLRTTAGRPRLGDHWPVSS